MAYGGYYPVSYTPMVQNIPNTQPVAPQPTNAQNALTWVQGEAGAKSFDRRDHERTERNTTEDV